MEYPLFGMTSIRRTVHEVLSKPAVDFLVGRIWEVVTFSHVNCRQREIDFGFRSR